MSELLKLAEREAEAEIEYNALRTYGHSPSKAAEIMLDAQRGDEFCRLYIVYLRTQATLLSKEGDAK
jgi:hypothetical protein